MDACVYEQPNEMRDSWSSELSAVRVYFEDVGNET